MTQPIRVTPEEPLYITAAERSFDVVDLEGGQIIVRTSEPARIETLNQDVGQTAALAKVLTTSVDELL